MQNIQLGGAAFALLALAGTMVAYERLRQNAKRPLFSGHEVITLYWMGYLTLFMLGIIFALAAVLR